MKLRSTADNKVLPKAGRNGFVWTFVQGSTFILRLNFVLKIPAFGNTRNVTGNITNDRTKRKVVYLQTQKLKQHEM